MTLISDDDISSGNRFKNRSGKTLFVDYCDAKWYLISQETNKVVVNGGFQGIKNYLELLCYERIKA